MNYLQLMKVIDRCLFKKKTFFKKKKIEATIGVRNIANLTNVNQTKSNTSSAHTSASEIMLAYGRSFFLNSPII